MDWNYNISCLIIRLSKGPMLEQGGRVGLKARLGQFASMELREVGLATIVLSLPLIKY
jgi:hypothetical protein